MPLPLNKLPLGIVHFMAYPQTMRGTGPILETMRDLIEDGAFSFLELTHIEDKAVRAEARLMLKNSGKRRSYGAQPCLLIGKHNLNDEDIARRRTAIQAMEKAVDEAVEMEAEAVAFLSGKDPGPAGRGQALKLLQDSVLNLCQYAKKADYNLKLILETFDRVSFGKNALLGPTEEAVSFAKTVRRDFSNFSLMLDLSHLPLLGEPPSAVKKAAEVLGHAHIGNCVMRHPGHPAYGDEHPPFGIAEGENNAPQVAEFFKALDETGYFNPKTNKIVSVEIKPLAGGSGADVIANAKSTLKEAYKILGWPEN